MKRVAIVGAGPSGLVAAKVLLRSQACQFKVTIFEKKSEVGGLWAVHKERPYDGLLNPEMPTNLSRFNIGFSDLHWSSIGLAGHIPYWPKAWQVCRYLQAYTNRFIPGQVFKFNTKVISAEAIGEPRNPAWKLQWQTVLNGPAGTEEGIFDYLIVATGFFSDSRIPPTMKSHDSSIKVVHSTKLRKVKDVAPDEVHDGDILLVVGGGMSGADVTTLLASQLSDARNGVANQQSQFGRLKLVQLCPEAAYALPLAAAYDSGEPAAPFFMPLDLAMYSLSQRPPGPIEMGVGKMPVETIKMIHQAFQNLVGDQGDLGVDGLRYTDTSRATYATLTEQYSGFIRSRDIDIHTGRMQSLTPAKLPGSAPRVTVTYKHGNESRDIERVCGIVYATGFTPQPALDFLSPEIRQRLEHDAEHNRLPILLDEHATLTSQIPGLAVIGFHEGAFWGSMEMEARLVERKWTQSNHGDEALASSSVMSHLKDLRRAMNEKHAEVPQYWMGDYVGLMEVIARQTDTKRNDLDLGERSGPVCVARYVDGTGDQTEADKMLAEYSHVLNASRTAALFVGRATFLAWQGHWTIERKIDSAMSSMPSGTLTGLASFGPRAVTDPEYDFEYLYSEQGAFTTQAGAVMNATRRYVYRYQEATDKITVWFVQDDGKTVDYLYHELVFDVGPKKAGWTATADHLCVNDMYKSAYTFKFQGSLLSTFGVTHTVQGPKKDYVSETWYTR